MLEDMMEKEYIAIASQILKHGGIDHKNMILVVDTPAHYLVVRAFTREAFDHLVQLYRADPANLVKYVNDLKKQPVIPGTVTFMWLPKHPRGRK